MSEAQTDAEKIRNKRLAKLAGSSSNNSIRTEDQDSLNDEESSPPATSFSAPKANNGSNLLANTRPSPAPSLSKHAATGQASALSPERVAKPRDQTKREVPTESLEVWEDRTLTSVFRFTLQPNNPKDAHGYKLFTLDGLHSELEESDSPLYLSTDNLQQAIIECGSGQSTFSPLEYLLPCWKRISKMVRASKSSNMSTEKQEILQEIRRLCMSSAIFAITVPDLFGQDPNGPNPLVQQLLLDPDHERGVDFDFLTESVARSHEDGSIQEAIVAAVEQLSRELATKTMISDYQPYVTAFRSVSRFPALVIAMSNSGRFLPARTPPQAIETQTLLGPLFRISPMQSEVAKSYFSAPKTRSRSNIVNAQSAQRVTLQTHQSELFNVVDRFIKSSKESRERTLDWFAHCVNTNHKRRALRPDPRVVSSDGFMINVTVVLDMLCEPFLDATYSKIFRIEAEYFRRTPRVQIQDETKMNADQSTADAFYGRKVSGTSHFISELFFLTAAAHRYGTEAANAKLEGFRRDLRRWDQQLEQAEAERVKYTNSPLALARFDEQMKRMKEKNEEAHCLCMAIEGVLLDSTVQARSMSFMRYVIVWLLRLVSGVDYPKEDFDLPLPAQQPEVFANLPEYFLEDIVDHFKFITSHLPDVISPTQCDELVRVCITFLRCSEYIKNPYLKSGLVSILFYGILPYRPGAVSGVLTDVLHSQQFSLKHLLHSLMQFYIECESTGAHTQFYDKFNIRYEIFQVIKSIWSNVIYRENLEHEARTNSDFFVHFTNLLLNDVTFVLDEVFSSFQKIVALTRELRTMPETSHPNPQDPTPEETARQEKEEALEEAKRKAKSYMSLTTSTMETLKLFTAALADAFTTPEVVQRLADMLDYNLDALVGPKTSEIAVENKQDYGFEPRSLLSDIVDIYLNLAHKESFRIAIARDGRSYRPANFDAALRILDKSVMKSKEELQRWQQLKQQVAEAKAAEDAEEEDLGEAPDEFYDPLLATIMTDPVTLPTSKAVMDRGTIRQHLLSDGHDPFNRAPLKIEDVVPNTELKSKIENWKQERKEAKRIERQSQMDTTPG